MNRSAIFSAMAAEPREDELLTVRQVAERLRVNPRTIRRWILAGRLPTERYGPRTTRVSAAAVARLQREEG